MRSVLAWIIVALAVVVLVVLLVRGSTPPDGGMPGATGVGRTLVIESADHPRTEETHFR